LEYAMVVACLALALFAMQIYIKRSMQGKLRLAADEIGEQYSAKHTSSNVTQTINTTPGENITIIGVPKFISVEVTDPVTKEKHIERREIIETTRTEPMTMSTGGGSFEETGKLSDEKVFE
jgi:hypothetical protein